MEELAVRGAHAMLFDDDAAAAFADSGGALLPWSLDSQILIDRYDVRHLLLDSTALTHRHRRHDPPSTDVSEAELDLERYRDLQPEEEQHPSDSSGRGKRDHDQVSPGYHNVPFDYGDTTTETRRSMSPPLKKLKEELPPFHPEFSIPDHLQAHLPATEKLHQIISGTARFVSGRGGQAEVILRVKQANNPTFGFLMPDHHLHPYFRYLVDHPELTAAVVTKKTSPDNSTKSSVKLSVSKPGDGLNLLGQAYSCDDDDDEEEDDETRRCEDVQKPRGFTVATIKEPPANIKMIIEKMVEFIARNGKEFEDIVKERDKSDERFQFLQPCHEFHPYYLSVLEKSEQTRRKMRNNH